jgi:hypothetical protein
MYTAVHFTLDNLIVTLFEAAVCAFPSRATQKTNASRKHRSQPYQSITGKDAEKEPEKRNPDFHIRTLT